MSNDTQEKKTRKVYSRSDIESFIEYYETKQNELKGKLDLFLSHSLKHEHAAVLKDYEMVGSFVAHARSHFNIDAI